VRLAKQQKEPIYFDLIYVSCREDCLVSHSNAIILMQMKLISLLQGGNRKRPEHSRNIRQEVRNKNNSDSKTQLENHPRVTEHADG
jgi:hypothetical protein